MWGFAEPSNTNRIPTLQSIILLKITKSPFYVTNYTLHKDLIVPFVRDNAVTAYTRFHEKHQPHTNPLVENFATLDLPNLRKALKLSVKFRSESELLLRLFSIIIIV